MKKAGTVVALLALIAAAPASAETLGSEGGFTYVKKTATIAGGMGESAEANARCASGSESTGGGVTVGGPPAGSAIATSGKVSELQWFADAFHLSTDKATLTSWAVCSKKASKISQGTAPESVPVAPANATETATCDLSQGFVTGGGVRTIGASSEWSLNATYPEDGGDGDTMPNDAWRTFTFHREGPARTILADVVCMKGKQPSYVVNQLASVEQPKTKLRAKCPKGKSVTGGGGFVSGGTDDSHITSTRPYDSKKDKGKVPDDGWEVKFFDDNGVTQDYRAYAVCK